MLLPESTCENDLKRHNRRSLSVERVPIYPGRYMSHWPNLRESVHACIGYIFQVLPLQSRVQQFHAYLYSLLFWPHTELSAKNEEKICGL